MNHRQLPVCLVAMIGLALISMPSTSAHDDGHTPRQVGPDETYAPSPVPDRIVLTFTGDPATSAAVTWRTSTEVTTPVAEIAVAEAGPNFRDKGRRVEASSQDLETDINIARFHTVVFDGLAPETKYVYRVGDGANWSEWVQFRTASTEAEPFSFVYFGDAQNDIKSMWSRVVREAYSDAPKAAFLLHAGDLVNRANSDGEWGEWFYAGGWLHATVPCIAIPGNHEYARGLLGRSLTDHWRATFAYPENGPEGLEESAYYFDYQGVRFVGLNSLERQEDQADWLDGVLADNPNTWTILTFHYPIYSTGRGRDNPELRALWQPIFDKYKVDLVLNGHDHTYGRTGPRVFAENLPTGLSTREGGTVYVVSVSGPKMYNHSETDVFKRIAEDTQLYQVIHIDGSTLRFEARTALGDLYDAFEIRKGQDGAPNQFVDMTPPTPERRRDGNE